MQKLSSKPTRCKVHNAESTAVIAGNTTGKPIDKQKDCNSHHHFPGANFLENNIIIKKCLSWREKEEKISPWVKFAVWLKTG